jgi:copper transport protein
VTPDLLSVTLRAAALAALFQAAGATFFLARFDAELGDSHALIIRLGRCAAWLAVALLLAHGLTDAARMAGSYGGMLDGGLQRLAWRSHDGLAHVLQAGGALFVAIGLSGARRGNGRRRIRIAVAGAVLALAAFLLTGHTSVHPQRTVLALLLGLHLLILAAWFGALAPLYVVLLREPLAAAADIVRRYSRLAVRLVPLLPIAGLAMAAILTPGVAVLHQPYGQLLVVKLCGYALLLVLAGLNHSRLGPALGSAGQALGAARWLRRSLLAEFLLLLAVLAATAMLTTFYSPDH